MFFLIKTALATDYGLIIIHKYSYLWSININWVKWTKTSARNKIWTYNLNIFSVPLYQLSYSSYIIYLFNIIEY